jgi:hypothetical protein
MLDEVLGLIDSQIQDIMKEIIALKDEKDYDPKYAHLLGQRFSLIILRTQLISTKVDIDASTTVLEVIRDFTPASGTLK